MLLFPGLRRQESEQDHLRSTGCQLVNGSTEVWKTNSGHCQSVNEELGPMKGFVQGTSGHQL